MDIVEDMQHRTAIVLGQVKEWDIVMDVIARGPPSTVAQITRIQWLRCRYGRLVAPNRVSEDLVGACLLRPKRHSIKASHLGFGCRRLVALRTGYNGYL